MEHIVYKTTNTNSQEYYIGVHSCKGENCYHWKNNKCTYLGSGNRIISQVQKYGVSIFKRKTLSTHKTREEAFKVEKKLVNLKDPLSLNLAEGGQGHKNPSRRKGKVVTFEGVTYQSIREMAKAYNTSPEHASRWVRGLTLRKGSFKSVTVDGVEYESQVEAQRATGYSYKTIQKFANSPTYKKTQAPIKPVRILGVDYKTTGEASKALGESIPTIRYRCLTKTRKFKDWNYT